jgi:uncharacterized membrane protein
MLRTKLNILWDDLRSSLWFRPSLWVIGFSILALALISLDRRLGTMRLEHLEYLEPVIFAAGVDGTRAMLGAISGAMLTVASLSFSIMMVAVVQAANAYSPRLLRHYLADTADQHVLGILLGTFIYSLLVLRVVQGTDESNFVPTISVTGAILLSLLSIYAFIYFINHVAHSIEVSSIVTHLRKESEGLIRHLFPEEIGQGGQGEESPSLPDGPWSTIESNHTGYIEAVSAHALLKIAKNAGAVLKLEHGIGEYVLQGTPLVTVWPATAHDAALDAACNLTITLGKERTLVQDLHYGARQLVDIALRALSPAVNDPTTAINCIDVLATLLAQIARQPRVSPYRYDEEGNLRVIAPGPTFESMMDLSFSQIRHYGRNDLHCVLRLIDVCADLGYVATGPNERAALWKHLSMIARSADQNMAEPLDRAAINRALERAVATLEQDGTPLLLDTAPPEEMMFGHLLPEEVMNPVERVS